VLVKGKEEMRGLCRQFDEQFGGAQQRIQREFKGNEWGEKDGSQLDG